MKKHMTRNMILMLVLDVILGIVLALYIANTGTVPAADNADTYTDGTYTAGRVGVFASRFLCTRVMIHHGIHVPGIHKKAKPGFAENLIDFTGQKRIHL